MLFSKKPLLEVELVPKSAWGHNLRSLLDKYEPEFKTEVSWDLLRKQAYVNAGNRCEICSGRGPKWPVECHEVWSYNENTKPCIQRLVRLIALCPLCHMAKHLGFATVQGRQVEVTEHLAIVNSWTKEQVAKHVLDVNESFVRRSRMKWRLDLGGLIDYGVPERDVRALMKLAGDSTFEDARDYDG